MTSQTISQRKALSQRPKRNPLKDALREVLDILKGAKDSIAKASEYQAKHFPNERKL